jgi:mono/diheme cytochrome c family protein
LNKFIPLLFCAAAGVMAIYWTNSTVAQQPASAPATTQASTQPSVQAASAIEAGKYLTNIGGCHDCHTPGWMESGGQGVPEEAMLTGLGVGFRGPWGTTYGSNLRLFASQFTEDDFVKVLKSRNTRPPMPWSIIHAMSNQDLRAVYKYLTSLKPQGKPAPAYVPPGVEPKTPYFVLDPSVTTKAYAMAATQPATAPAATQPAPVPVKP